MTSIHDKSSFIPGGGDMHNSHRNTFLGEAEGDDTPVMHSHNTTAQGQRSSKTKRSGAMPIGKGQTSAPGKGSMDRITPS